MFWTIFDRTDMKISLYRIVFRVEFDGDVHFCIAPPKSILLSIFSMCFLQLFRFPSFRKNLNFFFRAAAEPKSLPPRRFYKLVLHMGVSFADLAKPEAAANKRFPKISNAAVDVASNSAMTTSPFKKLTHHSFAFHFICISFHLQFFHVI